MKILTLILGLATAYILAVFALYAHFYPHQIPEPKADVSTLHNDWVNTHCTIRETITPSYLIDPESGWSRTIDMQYYKEMVGTLTGGSAYLMPTTTERAIVCVN